MSIVIENLTKKKNNDIILNNINLTIKNNSFFLIAGNNGAGKTTLIKCILNLYLYNQGTILINDKDINEKDYLLNVSYVPEKENFPNLKVKKYLMMLNSLNNIDHKKTNLNIEKYAKLLEIDHKLNSFLNTLSTGEKKKILIINALINDPTILIMDEPTESIDYHSRIIVYKLLADFAKKQNNIVIILSHKADEILDYCSDIAIMKNGEVKFNFKNNKKSKKSILQKYFV